MSKERSLITHFIPFNQNRFIIPTVIRIKIKIKKGLPKIKLLGNLTHATKEEYSSYIADTILFAKPQPLFRKISIYISDAFNQKLSALPIEQLLLVLKHYLGKVSPLDSPYFQNQPKQKALYYFLSELQAPIINFTHTLILLIPSMYQSQKLPSLLKNFHNR